MTSTATPAAATASTVRSTSATRVPPQGPVHGLGDDRAVHQRVGVGQADLEDVGPGLGHGAAASMAPSTVGKPAGQIADQGGAGCSAASLADGGRAGPRTRRRLLRSGAGSQRSDAVSMSLSPRPDRLTRTSVRAQPRAAAAHGQGVRGFERGDDALGAAQQREGGQASSSVTARSSARPVSLSSCARGRRRGSRGRRRCCGVSIDLALLVLQQVGAEPCRTPGVRR